MHILFITDNFPPEVNAPASRTFDHCAIWVKKGHKVTIITGAPNFPMGKVFSGYKNKIYFKEQMNGIEVRRVWTYIAKNEGVVKRVVDYLSFMASSFIAALFVKKPDLIIGTSPQFFTAVSAYLVSRVKRKPFIFELRDLWPESISEVGAVKMGLALRALTWLEMFLYHAAAQIISVTYSFKDSLVARGVDANKIFVVTNGSNENLPTYSLTAQSIKQSLGLENKFVLGYIGTIGMAHGLEIIPKTAALLKDHTDIHFLIIGDGAERGNVENLSRQLDCSSVQFCGLVPKEQIGAYWNALDACIIHLKNKPLFKTVIPSKLFEAMVFEVPVLHGVPGESEKIVRKENVGLVFDPENPEVLKNAILELKDNSTQRQQFKTNCQIAAKKFSRAALAEKMLAHLEELHARNTHAQ